MWNDESFPVGTGTFRILTFNFESNSIRHNIIYDLSFRISLFQNPIVQMLCESVVFPGTRCNE